MDIFTTLLTQPLANGLALFYRVLGQNMGLAIIAFSLFLRLALTPLTRPYMESMKKMKKYSKDLERLKKRHKGDRAKLMQAQAEFYKQKNINPSAGCLPYLLQIIVLIAFFNVFNRVLSPDGNPIERFNELLYEPLKFVAGTTLNTRFLYLNVTKPDIFELPGLPFPIPGPFLVLAAAIQFVSAKIAMPYIEAEKKFAKKTPGATDDILADTQSYMVYMFPIMTLFIGVRFPSGLALYWLLFSLYQAYQQYRTSGWGGLTPWLRKLGLLKLPDPNDKKRNKSN